MNPILKSILKFSVPLGFGIFLIYLFFRKLSPSDIEDMKFAVTTANYWWLLFSVFFTLLSQSIRALRWKALIGATGNRITFQYTIFMDFYTGHLAETFNPLIEWLFAHPVATGSFVLLSSLLGVFILRRLLESSNNASTRLGKVVQGFKEGILSIFKLEKPLVFIVQTLLIWICYFIMVLFAFKTIEQGNSLGAGAAISLLFFGTFGFLATPGGIGAYPLIAGYLLSLYGLEVHLGTTMGWILWVGQTFLIIIVGLFAFAMLSREKNKKPNLLHVKSKNS